MRILVLTPTFLPMIGGAEILLLEVFRRLAERHQICLITADKGLPPSDLDHLVNFQIHRFSDRVSFMKLPGHHLTRGIIPPFSLSAVDATRKVIKWFRPDVLNAHFAIHTGLAAIVAQKRYDVPTVLSFTGRDIPGPSTPRHWKLYDRWVAQNVSDITYITEYCRRALYNSSSPSSGHVIPGGVDLTAFHLKQDPTELRRRMEITPDSPILFSVQRLGREKRVDVIIRAMPEVIKKSPQTILIIGGIGPDRADLESLVKQMQLGNNIRFAGYIPTAELPLYYSLCDLFVFHSIYETFGLVLAEAMAAGKAIVSVSTTAIPEVVQEGKTGLLAPPMNPEVLAERILYLLNSPDERKRLGLNGRKWAEENFDWDIIASQYEAVLEQVVQ